MGDIAAKARIEALARLAFPERDWGRVSVDFDHGGVDVLTEAGGLLLGVQDTPHAAEAAEAALVVLVARRRLLEECSEPRIAEPKL